jgi:hypothetical protein
LVEEEATRAKADLETREPDDGVLRVGSDVPWYHGSPVLDFQEFDISKVNPNDPDALVNGFWFSSNRDEAEAAGMFPWGRPNAPDTQTREFRLNLDNPASRADVSRVYRRLTKEGEPSDNTAVREALEAEGYDGYIHEEAFVPTDAQRVEFDETGRLEIPTEGRFDPAEKKWLQRDENGYIDLYDDQAGGHVTGGWQSLDEYLAQQEMSTIVVFDPTKIKFVPLTTEEFDAEVDRRETAFIATNEAKDQAAQEAQARATEEVGATFLELDQLSDKTAEEITDLFSENQITEETYNALILADRLSNVGGESRNELQEFARRNAEVMNEYDSTLVATAILAGHPDVETGAETSSDLFGKRSEMAVGVLAPLLSLESQALLSIFRSTGCCPVRTTGNSTCQRNGDRARFRQVGKCF